MKNFIKCPKCGKEVVLPINKIGDDVYCPHCHRHFVISKQTRIALKIARYIFLGLFCGVILFLFGLNSQTNYILILAVTFCLAFFLANLSDKVAKFLVYHTIGYKYTDSITNEDVSRKKVN